MPKSREGFTLIELMIVMVIMGILATMAFSNWLSMQATAKEGAVKVNCHTVQLAAEDFAVRNNGVYSDGNDALPNGGGTLKDLLPGAHLLTNPFTKQVTEPQFGARAARAGETGYVAVIQNGVNVGYTIDGIGRDPIDGALIVLTSGQ